MKHIKHINEAYFSSQNWHDAPDPPEPERDTDRPDSQREFKCIAYTTYLALLCKKNNPRELYILQMDDPDVEDWLLQGGYSWDYADSEVHDYDWEDLVDKSCIEDLVTDSFKKGYLEKFKTTGKYAREVMPLEVGEGLDSYIRYADVPGFEDLEDQNPEKYAAIVKVDLPLAKYLEKEFEYRAYEHVDKAKRTGIKISQSSRGNRDYLKMLGALMRAFPEIE